MARLRGSSETGTILARATDAPHTGMLPAARGVPVGRCVRSRS
ncbi:hypothetical protein CU044_5199 [Streptomyces sp. L-9-10]|nr:hypothetical protein CU044_5199 [Streptomyces sp. L-9-10]